MDDKRAVAPLCRFGWPRLCECLFACDAQPVHLVAVVTDELIARCDRGWSARGPGPTASRR
jgi:hypothetical protein